MNMAKASQEDLKMAMELANALEALNSRWGASMPKKIAKPQREDEEEGFSLDDDENCRRVCEYLIRLTRGASLSRVVMGMAVLLDPANALVDPDADTLEHHPDRKDSVRLRWLTEDHADPDTRARCRELLGSMPLMTYSAATAAIDAAMLECAAVGAHNAKVSGPDGAAG